MSRARIPAAGRYLNRKRLRAAGNPSKTNLNHFSNHIPRVDLLSALVQPLRLLRSNVGYGLRALAKIQLGVVDTRDHAGICARTSILRVRARCDRKGKCEEADHQCRYYLTAM